MESVHTSKAQASMRMALIAMPWHIFNRPSVQLGTLKGFLEKSDSRIAVQAFHPYLHAAKILGGDVYHWISQDVWGCEALYSPLLFPGRYDQAKSIVKEAHKKSQESMAIDFDTTHAVLAESLTRFIEGEQWNNFNLVGFSVCFNQLFASLAAARMLKESRPDLPIVFGGSTCVSQSAVSLLTNFPQIDYIIQGEGEKPLLELCRYIRHEQVTLPSSIMSRTQNVSDKEMVSFCQFDDLSELPIPDFSDYFTEMQQWFGKEPFIPELPIEFSRGCWWGKCAFCNLNTQWRGYRAKKTDQMINEVITLSEKYECLDFSFTDNSLPVKESHRFFEKLAPLKHDFRFFGEIRVGHSNDDLKVMQRGGLVTVQAGIEALSESLLKKLKKGVSVIENIALMKDALARNIELDGNLIIEFPGSTQDEVDDTMKNLDFVWPFRPLAPASFFLGLGSPVDREPANYGIRAIVHHRHVAKLFPREMLPNLTFLIKEYRGDRTLQRGLWKPVVQKMSAWKAFHRKRARSSSGRGPALSYRNGGDFLIIRQELPNKPTLHHRLRGLSRDVYLFCTEMRDMDDLLDHFPRLNRDKLLQFIDSMVMKRLMFSQDEKYLSLAVRR